MRYKKKPKPVPASSPVILYDDREKNYWVLPWEMKKKRLKVGDYTFEGYEDRVAIEKKSGIAELFKNLTAKERPRFVRMLKRLSKYEYKCIVVEDNLNNVYPIWHTIRKKAPNMKLDPRAIYYWTARIVFDYKIPIIFTNSNTAIQTLFWEAYKQCTS